MVIPPGALDQTTFFPFMQALLKEGTAVATTQHPSAGFSGFPYEDFSGPPFNTREYRHEYLATGHLLKDLITEVFDQPVGFYAFGRSRGMLEGVGLLLAEPGAPFDGYVVAIGGNGRLGVIMAHIAAYKAGKIPLTNLPPTENFANNPTAQKVSNLVVDIQIADPEYRDYILSAVKSDGSPDLDEQLKRALAYDVSTRPKEVQRAWAVLGYDHHLTKPTIYLQGLRDRTNYPSEMLKFA